MRGTSDLSVTEKVLMPSPPVSHNQTQAHNLWSTQDGIGGKMDELQRLLVDALYGLFCCWSGFIDDALPFSSRVLMRYRGSVHDIFLNRLNQYYHYSDVIMGSMAFQIAGVSIFLNVCSGADQRKHQSSASLLFVRGIHRWPVDSPRKGLVTRKLFPFDDVIMYLLADTQQNDLCWIQIYIIL